MKSKITAKELLRWRFDQAKAEAAAAPGANLLLNQARSWWEQSPDKFQSLVASLDTSKVVGSQAVTKSKRSRGPKPVAALVVWANKQHEAAAHMKYFRVVDGKLCMLFRVGTPSPLIEPALEATFVSDTEARPLFCVPAIASADGEYCVETELSAELAQLWKRLKATNQMPFRLILRPDTLWNCQVAKHVSK